MAATLSEERRINLGESTALCFGTLTLDSSYPASGGEPIDAIGDLGYLKMFFEAGSGIVVKWDKATQSALAYWGNAGTASLMPEVTSTTDLSAQVIDYVALAVR